jgi:hypothetical protein
MKFPFLPKVYNKKEKRYVAKIDSVLVLTQKERMTAVIKNKKL